MKRTWLILLSVLLISACSESTSTTPGGGGSGGEGGDGGAGGAGGVVGGALVYPHLDCDSLVPEFCGYPFPSNVYTVEDANTVTGRRACSRITISETTGKFFAGSCPMWGGEVSLVGYVDLSNAQCSCRGIVGTGGWRGEGICALRASAVSIGGLSDEC